MTLSRIERRAFLRAGGLAAAILPFAGLHAPAASASPSAALTARLPGPLVSWLVFDPDHGGTVRLVAIDARSQPTQELERDSFPLIPLAQAGRRAQELGLRRVATAWGVARDSCLVAPGRIAHPPSGRVHGFAVWSDFT